MTLYFKRLGLHTALASVCAMGAINLASAQQPKPDGVKSANPQTNQAAATPGSGGAASGQQAVPVEVIKVSSGAVFEDVTATGTVKAAESVMLRSEIAGRIFKINFSDAMKVKKGQVLIELDSALQQAEKDQSQAELDLAQANYKRNEELAAKQFVSTRVKDEAQSQVKVAQAKLALSEARLQRALIRAPFDGVVGLRNVSVGEYVKDGSDLVTVDDLSRVRIDFKLPERYAAQAKMGMKVLLEPDSAMKIKNLAGKVDSIDTVLDVNGRSLTLRVRTVNPQQLLKPGMFVKARLILSERSGAILVPDESVQAQGRESLVYKLQDDKAVRTPVKTGVRQDGKIEITEGLQIGDTIIQVGLQRINRDGQPVRVVERKTAKPVTDAKSGAPDQGTKRSKKPE